MVAKIQNDLTEEKHHSFPRRREKRSELQQKLHRSTALTEQENTQLNHKLAAIRARRQSAVVTPFQVGDSVTDAHVSPIVSDPPQVVPEPQPAEPALPQSNNTLADLTVFLKDYTAGVDFDDNARDRAPDSNSDQTNAEAADASQKIMSTIAACYGDALRNAKGLHATIDVALKIYHDLGILLRLMHYKHNSLGVRYDIDIYFQQLEAFLEIAMGQPVSRLGVRDLIERRKVSPRYLPNTLPDFMSRPEVGQDRKLFLHQRAIEYKQAELAGKTIPLDRANETEWIGKEVLALHHAISDPALDPAKINYLYDVVVPQLMLHIKHKLKELLITITDEKVPNETRVYLESHVLGLYLEYINEYSLNQIAAIRNENISLGDMQAKLLALLNSDSDPKTFVDLSRFINGKARMKDNVGQILSLPKYEYYNRIRYFDDAAREANRHFIKDGKLYEWGGPENSFTMKPATTANLSSKAVSGYAAMTINSLGEIYFTNHWSAFYNGQNQNEFQFHSTHNAGMNVIAPGEMKVAVNGQVLGMTGESGHYKPDFDQYFNGYVSLRDRGLDFSACVFTHTDRDSNRKSFWNEAGFQLFYLKTAREKNDLQKVSGILNKTFEVVSFDGPHGQQKLNSIQVTVNEVGELTQMTCNYAPGNQYLDAFLNTYAALQEKGIDLRNCKLQVQDEVSGQTLLLDRSEFFSFYLLHAVAHNNVMRATSLIQQGVKPMAMGDPQLLVLYAAQRGCTREMFMHLEVLGLHLNYQNDVKQNALHIALENNRLDTCKALLELGIDPNQEDANGVVPANDPRIQNLLALNTEAKMQDENEHFLAYAEINNKDPNTESEVTPENVSLSAESAVISEVEHVEHVRTTDDEIFNSVANESKKIDYDLMPAIDQIVSPTDQNKIPEVEQVLPANSEAVAEEVAEVETELYQRHTLVEATENYLRELEETLRNLQLDFPVPAKNLALDRHHIEAQLSDTVVIHRERARLLELQRQGQVLQDQLKQDADSAHSKPQLNRLNRALEMVKNGDSMLSETTSGYVQAYKKYRHQNHDLLVPEIQQLNQHEVGFDEVSAQLKQVTQHLGFYKHAQLQIAETTNKRALFGMTRDQKCLLPKLPNYLLGLEEGLLKRKNELNAAEEKLARLKHGLEAEGPEKINNAFAPGSAEAILSHYSHSEIKFDIDQLETQIQVCRNDIELKEQEVEQQRAWLREHMPAKREQQFLVREIQQLQNRVQRGEQLLKEHRANPNRKLSTEAIAVIENEVRVLRENEMRIRELQATVRYLPLKTETEQRSMLTALNSLQTDITRQLEYWRDQSQQLADTKASVRAGVVADKDVVKSREARLDRLKTGYIEISARKKAEMPMRQSMGEIMYQRSEPLRSARKGFSRKAAAFDLSGMISDGKHYHDNGLYYSRQSSEDGPIIRYVDAKKSPLPITVEEANLHTSRNQSELILKFCIENYGPQVALRDNECVVEGEGRLVRETCIILKALGCKPFISDTQAFMPTFEDRIAIRARQEELIDLGIIDGKTMTENLAASASRIHQVSRFIKAH